MSQTVTLRIVGENGQVVGVIRTTKAELAGLGKTAGDTGRQTQGAARDMDAMGASSERTRGRLAALNGTVGQFKSLIGGALLVQTVRDLARTADAYKDIEGKLAQVTKGERELATAKAQTFAIAQQYYQQWDATATLYGRIALATDRVTVSHKRIAEVVKTVNAGLLVSRASAAESASAMLQLSQSIGSGVLRGEEFRAVFEAAPQLMQTLADAIGKPIGELKILAQNGELTTDMLLDAFSGPKARELQARAADVPLTISRAWLQMRNDVLKGLGQFDKQVGASSAVAGSITGLTQNLGALTKIGGALALVLAGRLVSGLVGLSTQFISNQVASTRAYVAAVRLNAGLTTTQALVIRTAAGVRTLGASLLSLAGGWIGAAVIAIGLLVSKLASARAEAKQLREEVASAIAESNQFLDTNDLNIALSSGSSLLADRQKLQDAIAARQRKADLLSSVSPGSAAALLDTAQARSQQADLDEVNRRLALNAQRIKEVTERQAARRAEEGNGTKQSKAFNSELAEQNEKLKVERIEREQGIRAALEYQAMQAAGAKSVGELSQATRDLIDTQVREVTAADAYKKTQSDGAKAARESKKLTDEQAEAQTRYADSLEIARATLEGPMAKAQAEHDQAIRALDADYAKHNLALETYNGLKDVEDAKLQRVKDGMLTADGMLQKISADYAEQIRMAGLSGEAYRVEEALMRRLNDAREQHLKVTPEIVAGWREEIAQGERQVSIADAARRAADDYQQSWLNAVQSVGRAFGDWITGSISSLSDLGDALADIGKRWFSDQFSQGFTRFLNGGYADAGTTGSGGGWLAQLIGGSQTLQKVAGWFGFGGGASPAAAGMGWANAYGAGAQLAAGAGVLLPQYGGGSLVGAGAAAAQGSGYGSSLLSTAASFKPGTLGKFLQSPAAPWLGAAVGAYYGYKSTDDSTGKVLAGAAYGAAGYAGTAAVGAGLAASAGGATVGAAASAGLAAIPVVGWIALAAIAVNAISGGKLFGTKYRMDSAETTFNYSDRGIGGMTEIEKSRQKALFGGTKRTTSTQALSDDARKAMNEAFGAIDKAVTQAAGQLGVSVPTLLGATFTQEFDSKGKLKSEFGQIAGRVYREAQDAFNQRYLAENLLNVAGVAGGHAATIQQLANGYRGSPEALTDFATLMLAITSDAKAGKLLWDDTDAALQNAVASLKLFQRAGESIAETYQRVTQGVGAYADMVAGVRSELLTHDLSEYAQAQVQIELQYRAQVKQANDLAKALGLSGARSADLAAIEQLRAQRMADLQQQMEKERDNFLGQLRISDLAPGTDQSKFTDAMQQLRDAVGRGDLQAAEQLSQQTLGYGRNLYASGSDYNALYNTVTGLLNQLDPADAGLTPNLLQDVVDQLSTLPQNIAAAMFNLVASPATLPPPPSSSGSSGASSAGGSSGSSSSTKAPHGPLEPVANSRATDALLGMAADTREILRLQKRDTLVAAR